ncbi:MAG TPA: purine-nucleoside phosphorylase [Candidatus Eisenbacteria bacterium]|nr:purine-nucleoside phosphorylase [Candidatus Eisenbacteria bacterium]
MSTAFPRRRAGEDAAAPFDPEAALRVIRKRTQASPRVALVLGSGLGVLAEGVAWEASIATTDLPGLPRSTVAGHSGRLLLGRWAGRTVVVAQGRSHLYEGYSAEEVTRMIRLFHGLGAKALVLTNAAGGITHRMTPGSLMLVEDQVSLQWRSPSRPGDPESDVEEEGRRALVPPGPRGLAARPTYAPDLLAKAARAAVVAGVRAERGTLGVMLGPSYETPAEIAMLERMGADAVCMSTAAEASLASSLGLPTVGISCITNRAAGKSPVPLRHAEVTGAVQAVAPALRSLLERLILALA